MKRILFYSIIVLWCGPAAQGKIALPDIISDNMVLQQNTHVKLWGKATPDSDVKVKSTWDSQTYTTRSGQDGKWVISLSTPKAGFEPQEISISDGETLTLRNILIGEVWLCSGQSNMEMPLNGFRNNPVMDAHETIANASAYKGLRIATIRKTAALIPQETCAGEWQVSTPETLQGCSATAFHFAHSIGKILDVPVGIIACAWGGSTVEGWLPKEVLEAYPDVDIKQAGNKEITEFRQPMIMYNGMLKPLQNYTVKGFLWYQGESNVERHNTYAARLATMVNLWRKEWNLGELPFYFVEIAPYSGYGKGISGALLREAQFNAQALIPNSGMASTNDLVEEYEADNIHPKNKTEVGKRLAYLALANTYGISGIACRGPVFDSMEIMDNTAIISFKHAQDGYYYQKDIEGFEVAAADSIFHPATARLHEGRKVAVSSNAVEKPVAVRYAFRNYQPGNLKNTRGLPAYPFRTDNWE